MITFPRHPPRSENPGAFETVQKTFRFGTDGRFVAQVINFFIVIWVLKKFAFGPIQTMLEQRRNRIAEGEEKLKQHRATTRRVRTDDRRRHRQGQRGRRPPDQRGQTGCRRLHRAESPGSHRPSPADSHQSGSRRQGRPRPPQLGTQARIRPPGGRHHRASHRQGAHRRRPEAHQRGRARQGRRLIARLPLPRLMKISKVAATTARRLFGLCQTGGRLDDAKLRTRGRPLDRIPAARLPRRARRAPAPDPPRPRAPQGDRRKRRGTR